MWKMLGLGLVISLAACSGSDSGPTGSVDPAPTPTPVAPAPTPPAQTWPVVYNLATLKSPNALGTVYTRSTTCNRVLRSSLEAGTITLRQDNVAEVYLRAWEERPSSTNAPGIPCPTFIMVDLSSTKKGTYTITGTGTARQITITVGATQFATGAVGTTGFATSLTLAAPGYTVFGTGKPFDPIEASSWTIQR